MQGITSAPVRRRTLDDSARSLYDAFAGLAADVCGAPIGLVSLIDRSDAWSEAFVVAGAGDVVSPEIVFCDATVAAGALTVSEDEGGTYAGIPLANAAGRVLGTLAVVDRPARTFADAERSALAVIAASLVDAMESRHDEPSWNVDQIALLGHALEKVADPIAIFRHGETNAKPWAVYANRAFTELFGYTFADVVGKEPSFLAGPGTTPPPREKIIAANNSAPVDYGTIVLYTKTKEPLLIEMVLHHLNETHRILSYRDVTRERTAQTNLADANARLQSFVAINNDAIFTLDATGKFVDANRAAETMLGAANVDVAFPDTSEFVSTLHADDGRAVTVECKTVPIVVHGRAEGSYVVARDVTERHRLASLVRKQAERATALCAIAALTENSDLEQIDAIIALVLETFDMQFGYVSEIVGPNLVFRNAVGDLIYRVDETVPLDQTRVARSLGPGDIFTIDDLEDFPIPKPHRYGGWHGSIMAPIVVGNRVHGTMGFTSRSILSFDESDRDFMRLIGSLVSSAVERRVQGQALDRLAYYDDLSGLPNRAHFMRRLEREIALPGQTFALHFIDLDGFKGLNDRHGHAMGDLALREAARRLQRACRRNDLTARLGGDEFVALQFDLSNRDDARSFGERIVETLSSPYRLDGHAIVLGASVGVALYPRDGTEPETLMRRADAALYRAKTAGKHRVEVHSGPIVLPGRTR